MARETETGQKMKILVLDSDIEIRKEIFDHWSIPNTELSESAGGSNAIKLISQGGFGAIFLSTDLLQIDNLDILGLCKEHNPGVEVFILTTARDLPKAEQSVQRSAHSFLVKPVNIKLMESLALKSVSRSLSRVNLRVMQEQLLEDVLGTTPAMKKILKTVSKVAPTNSTILIEGESGTGKEFLANILHRLSNRAEENFVAVNCGAIPENLVESELFGSRKGSFTGAVQDRKGLFEVADGGTLFLDEVGELATSAQVKLLRFLQERELRRVGDTESKFVDVRVIAATNKDLRKAVQAGAFREDLYYRLAVFCLHLPPLRERRGTIPSLVRTFVKKFNAMHKKHIQGIAKTAEAILMQYEYPGNIRQLENIIEHAVAMAEGDYINLEDLPEYIQRPGEPTVFALPKSGDLSFSSEQSPRFLSLSEVERNHIQIALETFNYNHTEVSKKLGISRSTLWRKMKEHQLQDSKND